MEQKKWSEEAWLAATPLIEETKKLPFLQELAAGTLPGAKFRQYISQDRLYLEVYTRVLAHIASRLPDMDDVATFLSFAVDGVAVEKALHEQFNPDKSVDMSQACLFYTSFLWAHSQADIAVEAAAVLPCFWVYQHVGKYIHAIAKLEGNPYRAWIETYADPAFDQSTAWAIAICDSLASATTPAIRRQMTEAFLAATRLEHLFWQL